MSPSIPGSSVIKAGLKNTVLDDAASVLDIEIQALVDLKGRLGEEFEQAVELMLACRGKVVVSGMGKSGHVARKIAATLASTGTPAIFMHPAEASHGDLGMVHRDDLVLALSNSGGTEELLRLLGPLRRLGVSVIGLTGNPDSELARRAEVNLNGSVEKEACPLGLAPTASTTAALALGDALAVCLLKKRGFRQEDYALFHPGGNLGKQLMTTVADLMEKGQNLPLVRQAQNVAAVIRELQDKHYGVTAVVDDAGVLVGAFSMGDLTRLNIKDPSGAFMGRPVATVMTSEPKSIAPDQLAARALNHMETHRIRALFVVDARHKPIGILGLYEVLEAIDY